ncbi:MAG: glutamate dehydrogenase [Flavobacteriaceae bacterium]|jgi:hypothetical protein|nr:glutamate dehydrogenase [Flavobacteriaceae bacterium]
MNNISMKYRLLLIGFVISFPFYGQTYGSHEIGFYLGAPSIQTDYGQRNNFMSNVGGNIGVGAGIIHYYQFSDYRYKWFQRGNFFSEHFKIRSEISYAQADLQHFGIWVDPSHTSVEADKLRAMHGSTSIINMGSQLEFHIRDLVDYGLRYYKWNYSPYVGLGLQVNVYKPTVISDYGTADWKQNPTILPYKWSLPGAVNEKRGTTFSITLNAGSRIAIGEYSDIFIDTRWHYFMSNYVDGLNAKVDENKYNDWMLLFQFGYIYYLE